MNIDIISKVYYLNKFILGTRILYFYSIILNIRILIVNLTKKQLLRIFDTRFANHIEK